MTLPDPGSRIIKLAIMAVGGQGGGVLTGWIEAMARAQGYACQATSVAGVAQRTGATIYYIEIAEPGEATPVFALAPTPGDIDIVIAAEMMEAGRAVMRGFVTPDRTTLIASSHRALAVSEKMVPGDGIANAEEVRAAADIAAARAIFFDMEALAVQHGSVISATLFGALAASGCLPFPRTAFEDAIRSGSHGVAASLQAFAAAFEAEAPVLAGAAPALRETPVVHGPSALRSGWEALHAELAALPAEVRDLAEAGLKKVVDFMDLAYGREYLDRLAPFASADGGEDGHALTASAAKYIANRMAYDDVIRVADLKTRTSRTEAIADDADRIVQVTEYFSPRAEEIAGLLPARLGQRVERNSKWMARLERMFGGGRRIRSDKITGFAVLFLLGGLKGYRRRTHRHAIEQSQLDGWLTTAMDLAPKDPALATEVLRCGRLIKGYSGTHARGLTKFAKAMEAVKVLEQQPNAAQRLCALREAALEDEDGTKLDALLGSL